MRDPVSTTLRRVARHLRIALRFAISNAMFVFLVAKELVLQTAGE